ncbi:MAG TPA: hypothetical protein VM056_02515 [Terriglobales bacterium]|nr:hypothetical protein [Terriglobales bacterium]
MYTGSIIDELVRSVEIVEEHFYTAPVPGTRRHYAGTEQYGLRSYEFGIQQKAEVA